MTAIAEKISELEVQALKIQNKIEWLQSVAESFPDVVITTSRSQYERYGSPAANSMVTDVEYGKSCGCCVDCVWYAYPYLEFKGLRLYSRPIRFNIGTGMENGIEPDSEWAEEMTASHIPVKIIDSITAFLEERKPLESEDNEEGVDND